MTDTQYTLLVKALFLEYYQRRISQVEYREQRHKIISEMDRRYNGEPR